MGVSLCRTPRCWCTSTEVVHQALFRCFEWKFNNLLLIFFKSYKDSWITLDSSSASLIFVFLFVGLWYSGRRQRNSDLRRTEAKNSHRQSVDPQSTNPAARRGYFCLGHREWKGEYFWVQSVWIFVIHNLQLHFLVVLIAFEFFPSSLLRYSWFWIATWKEC